MHVLSSLKYSEFLIGRLLSADLRVFSLVLAVVLYACLGSPTPDVLSWVEIVIGGLLVFALGVCAVQSLTRVDSVGRWMIFGVLFLVYGLTVGVLGGIISGVSLSGMVRDVLPFGFMFMPLFLFSLARDARFFKVYLMAFAVLGGVFALRAGAPTLGLSFHMGYEALYYLGNSPAVLFVALFSLGTGISVLSRGLSVRTVMFAGLCFIAFLMASVPIVVTAQRASMAAIVVYGVLIFAAMLCRAPRRMIVIGVCLAIASVEILGGFVGGALESVVSKSRLVGANMRVEEWGAVWSEISGQPMTLLFGQGWGAVFSSPAVADISVNYTHSLFSAMLWKLGFVGFVLCGAYIGALLLSLIARMRGREVLVLALIAPLLIDVFLYAAYKSLDFGLFLGLIGLVIFRHSAQSGIESDASLMYEKHKGASQSHHAKG